MSKLSSVDKRILETLKEEVEIISGLGNSKSWTQKDYDFLVFFIEERTKVRISLSTLRRIYNNEYNRLPHISTLNALTRLTYRMDWQPFKKQWIENKREEPIIFKKSKQASINLKFMLLGFILIGTIIMFFINFDKKNEKQVRKIEIQGDIKFKTDKTVTTGVPNTVMFNYDISNIVADSFFIQQSWNTSNKVPVDSSGYLSSIYYYPGYHRAKLIANDSVIQKAPVHITTKGWLPLIRYDYYDHIPVYLVSDTLKSNGAMLVNEQDLTQKVNSSKDFLLSYYNVQDFGELNSDNFTLTTRFKNNSIKNYTCPQFELMIMCEADIYRVKLTSKGCMNMAKVKIGEITREAASFDLSGFGTDLDTWQDLNINVTNKYGEVYLNGKKIFDTHYKSDFGKIVGISYTYTGLGSVDFIKILNEHGEVVFEDEF